MWRGGGDFRGSLYVIYGGERPPPSKSLSWVFWPFGGKVHFFQIRGGNFCKKPWGGGESKRHSHFLLLALTEVKFNLTFFTSTFFTHTFYRPTSQIFLDLGGGTGNAESGWGNSECRSYWSLEDQYSLVYSIFLLKILVQNSIIYCKVDFQ